jgi:hypothetical protein
MSLILSSGPTLNTRWEPSGDVNNVESAQTTQMSFSKRWGRSSRGRCRYLESPFLLLGAQMEEALRHSYLSALSAVANQSGNRELCWDMR